MRFKNCISYFTENTLHPNYKDGPVNAVEEYDRSYSKHLTEVRKYTPWGKMQSSKRVVAIYTSIQQPVAFKELRNPHFKNPSM
jgi:hypothetical protein